MERKLGDAVNGLIMAIGFCLIVFGVFFSRPQDTASNFPQWPEDIKTITVSIGTSIMATALISMVTARYLLKTEKTKEIIKEWGLLSLYETKAGEMNQEANALLKNSDKQIDIITIGMTNYIAFQGEVLIEKIKSGVKVRIISCYPKTVFIEQRKRDEDSSGWCEEVGGISEEVIKLTQWVEKIKSENPQLNKELEIKYLKTYPAFSYLRIDDTVFFGPNLYLMPSQQNMAAGFHKNGKGYRNLTNYFDKLWLNDLILSASI